MTSIGIIGRRDYEGRMEFITAFADSMGSDLKNGSKGDYFPKIFRVGKDRASLLMGTGSGELIYQTAAYLANSPTTAVSKLAEETLAITNEILMKASGNKPEEVVKLKKGLNFLIAGPDKDDLQAYRVNATGVRGNEDDRYENRGAEPIVFQAGDWNGSFDGSGYGPIRDYLNGQSDADRPLIVRDIADAMAVGHELTIRGGTRDIGVNDKLHYGIITPKGTHLILHPEASYPIGLNPLDYLFGLTGVKLNNFDDRSPVKEQIETRKKGSNIISTLNDFYAALDMQLRESVDMKSSFTRTAEQFAGNEEYLPFLQEIRGMRVDIKSRLVKSIEALMSGRIAELVAVIKTQRDHRESLSQKALTYVSE